MNTLIAWFNLISKDVKKPIKIATSLIAGTAGLLTAVHTTLSYVFPEPKEVALEKFDVAANNESGYHYTYPKNNKSTKLHYSVTPEHSIWLAIPIGTQQKVATGSITADGYSSSDFTPNPLRPCPNSNLGALVVIRYKDKACLASSSQSFFQAEPGETYIFVMNDVKDGYADNKGSISVQLVKNKKSDSKN